MSYMNSPPKPFSFIPLSPILGVVSIGIIFAFTYKFYCTIVTILSAFPNTSHLPLVPALPLGQGLFCPPVLRFYRRKKEKRDNEKHDILANLG
jgi:hypothetical protein